MADTNKCIWTWISFGDFWATGCGQAHGDEKDNPQNNQCSYCANEIEIDSAEMPSWAVQEI